MLQQSIKEKLIAFRVEQSITCCSTKTRLGLHRTILGYIFSFEKMYPNIGQCKETASCNPSDREKDGNGGQ
jgi:hypothetical protein